MTVTTVLFDLDGVLRHFDPATAGRIEGAHGIAPGSIEAAAFAPDLLRAVTVGDITNEAWIVAIGEAIDSPAAAAEWRRQPFIVDDAVLEVTQELRGGGAHVSLLSNATDGLHDELVGTSILDAFERIFNSAEIGCSKPTAAAYLIVLEALGVDPDTVLLVDDRLAHVEAACRLGMLGHHHRGRGSDAADRLRRALRSAGLLDNVGGLTSRDAEVVERASGQV